MDVNIHITRAVFTTVMNVFAIGFLFVVILNRKKENNTLNVERKLYSILAASCIAVLVLDCASWWVDCSSFYGAETVNFIINSIGFLFNPFPAAVWMVYLDYKVFKDRTRFRKYALLYLLPIIVNTLAVIVNIFYPLLFYIAEGNQYVRGDYMLISTVTSVVCVIYSLFITVIFRKRIKRNNLIPFLIFVLIPLFCTVIQVFCYGYSIIGMGEAFAIMIVYVCLQNDMMNIDYLTGIGNRRALEEHIVSEFNKKDVAFAGIMLDLDDFKNINDTYGHVVGDKALMSAANILASVTTVDDLVARYAGDEFVVILRTRGERIDEAVSVIRQKTEEFNSLGEEYKLSFSMGFATAGEVKNDNLETFLKRMDEHLYIDKRNKKGDNAR